MGQTVSSSVVEGVATEEAAAWVTKNNYYVSVGLNWHGMRERDKTA